METSFAVAHRKKGRDTARACVHILSLESNGTGDFGSSWHSMYRAVSRGDQPFELELLRDALRTEIRAVELGPDANTLGFDLCRARLRIESSPSPRAAFSVIYLLAVLSFSDAPRADDADEDDAFTAYDMLPCLEYEDGVLRFRGSKVRGRRLATSISVFPDGRVEIETSGRGNAPVQWIDRLTGSRGSSPS
jgi:hypothetical protein